MPSVAARPTNAGGGVPDPVALALGVRNVPVPAPACASDALPAPAVGPKALARRAAPAAAAALDAVANGPLAKTFPAGASGGRSSTKGCSTGPPLARRILGGAGDSPAARRSSSARAWRRRRRHRRNTMSARMTQMRTPTTAPTMAPVLDLEWSEEIAAAGVVRPLAEAPDAVLGKVLLAGGISGWQEGAVKSSLC